MHPAEQTAVYESAKPCLPKTPWHLTVTDSDMLFLTEMFSSEKSWSSSAVLWFYQIITSVLWLKIHSDTMDTCHQGCQHLTLGVTQTFVFCQITRSPDNVFPTTNHYGLMINSSDWADLWLKEAPWPLFCPLISWPCSWFLTDLARVFWWCRCLLFWFWTPVCHRQLGSSFPETIFLPRNSVTHKIRKFHFF